MVPNAGNHADAGLLQQQGSGPAAPVNTGAIASPTGIPSFLAGRFEEIMAEMVEGIIITDMEGRVQWVNKAVLRLLELSDTQAALGISFEQLFYGYGCETYDLSYRSVVPGIKQKDLPGLLHATPFKQTLLCCLPSGRTTCLDTVYSLLMDQSHQQDQQDQQQPVGIICHLHDLTDFYLTHVNTARSNAALLSLINAIAHLRDLLIAPPSGETLALPPSVHSIGQHLADLIRNLLGGQATFLFSLGAHDRRLYYIAFSGLTPEQAALRWENSGRFGIEDILDQEAIARLYAHQQVNVDREHIRIPFLPSVDFPAENLYWTPLFVKQELVGMFVLGRGRPCNAEESELVQAVAALTTLMIEYVRSFALTDQEKGAQLVSQATDQIIDAFLTQASHELKTPLTTIKGNIQLALRRLAKLKDQSRTPCETVYPSIVQVLESLEAANDSARTQERIIRNLIDDTQIQTNTLELHRQHSALAALVRETVAHYQKQYPTRQVTLLLPSQELWVTVDRRRIQQVVQSYLINAHYQSPADHPIIVRLRSEGGQAYLSIHDAGPGIALEEQEHIWERLYQSLDTSQQSSLDLSMGMNFYLCRTLIERHHGQVGVESIPGRGTIFWFSLPLVQDNTQDDNAGE